MDMPHPAGQAPTLDDIAHYRREGWLLLRGLLGPRHVAASLDALAGLATGRVPARQTTLMWENGPRPRARRPKSASYASANTWISARTPRRCATRR